MKAILAIIVFYVFSGVNYAYQTVSPVQLKVSENKRISSQNSDLHHVEADLVIHPLNPKHWLVAAMVFDDPVSWKYHCATWVSQNSGVSWKRTDFPKTSADPQVAIDENNNAYFSCLGQSGDINEYYYVSRDGGITWPTEYLISGGHDHPFLVSEGSTTYWVSTTRGNTQLNFRKAEDGGELINQQLLKISVSEYKNNDNFKHNILSDGSLVVPFSNFYSTNRGAVTDAVYLLKSSNGGKTISVPILISREVGSSKGIGSLLVGKDKYEDELYLLYALGQGFSEFNGIGMSISRDKGETWKDRVVQEPVPSDNRFYAPTGTVNKDGVIGVYWYDRRNDPKREKNDVYFTASLDGGNSFLPAVRVTDINSKPNLRSSEARISRAFPGGGHYSGISVLPDGSFQLVWSDSRSGKHQLYTSNIKIEK